MELLTREWTQLLGSSDYDRGYSISTADDGSIYITGSVRGDLDGQTNSGEDDVFISKFNSDGSKQWTQLLGSSDWDSGYSITTADDGSIYITGTTYGDFDGQTNGGSGDVFISKFNSDGSKQWTQVLGSSDFETGKSISIADDGSIYIMGNTSGDLDGQTNSGVYDVFISKFNSDGSKQWTQLLGSAVYESGNSISTADDGSIYITGFTFGDLDGQTNGGSYDVFISKFNSDGSKQWTQLLGSSEDEYGNSITTADDGSIYITGFTFGDLDGQTNSGEDDVFISKFNSDGSKQWTQLVGSSEDDIGYSISTADDGSIYITGFTAGDLDGQTNSGNSDVFISKFGLNDSFVVLSVSTFDENLTPGSAVATLITTDPDSGDTHAYSLVTGDGDADNSAFTIDGDQLKIVDSPDFETKSSYSIRVQEKDSGGLTFEKSFTLTVNDLQEINMEHLTREWTQLLGSSDWDNGYSITTADDGSIYITGETMGDLDGQTNGGWYDVLISKFNSDGSKQWTQLLGSLEDEYGNSITTADDGSIYIMGDTYGDLDGQTNSGSSDIFISKFNSDGSKQWTQLLGTADYDSGNSISTADDGSIYITGVTRGDLDGQTNGGRGDVFISKFNSDGSKQWTQLLGSSDYETGKSISIADDGSIYIMGDTSGDLDGQTNSGGSDIFISKFNSDGSKQWTQLLGSSDWERGNSITTADDGSIYITGEALGDLDGQTNSGNGDVFISKFNSDGSKQWTQLLGSSDYEIGNSISTTDDGSIYITGSARGDLDGQTNSGEDDLLISKFNSDGSKQWTQLLGSSEDDYGSSITTADDGSIYITGFTGGDLDGQTNRGKDDAFIIKFIDNRSSDLNEIDYDFNGDDSVTIEEDAVIGLRSMFGTFPGDALTSNVLNNESSKSLVQVQQEMTSYFQNSHFDLDADGVISPLTDGIQLIEEMQALIQDDSSESVIA
ncbi:RTX toxin determinant A [Synechococcus sp. A15-127]|uniref:cadherin repeat domain-containing protein n=1 Tax=Synechococcus sp. A15-127 TaxID=1050624 RepID=UPI001646C697|nr:cadherin repeat domain-containing protein [Synechococcus sp. A15-127]QNI94103.1 RTX toxin determinant A [Synechococcus sp. A15-127]